MPGVVQGRAPAIVWENLLIDVFLADESYEYFTITMDLHAVQSSGVRGQGLVGIRLWVLGFGV